MLNPSSQQLPPVHAREKWTLLGADGQISHLLQSLPVLLLSSSAASTLIVLRCGTCSYPPVVN